jgi:hypothetical protein
VQESPLPSGEGFSAINSKFEARNTKQYPNLKIPNKESPVMPKFFFVIGVLII